MPRSKMQSFALFDFYILPKICILPSQVVMPPSFTSRPPTPSPMLQHGNTLFFIFSPLINELTRSKRTLQCGSKDVLIHTVNSKDLFHPQNAKLTLRPLELWQNDPRRKAKQWDQIWPYGACPVPVNTHFRALMTFIRRPS